MNLLSSFKIPTGARGSVTMTAVSVEVILREKNSTPNSGSRSSIMVTFIHAMLLPGPSISVTIFGR